MKHFSITVTGKVQDVYFRKYAQAEAQKLGLQGFARNEPNGSVYIEVEGDEAALNEFLAWCHQGSPEAVVHEVQHVQKSPVPHSGFTTS